jgi:hypothetical protein
MSVQLAAVTFDCADATKVAAFWSAVLEHPVDEGASPDFAAIGLAEGNQREPAWMFVSVPEAKAAKNRCHPDLATPDLPREVERLLALGAVKLGEFEEGGAQWTTLADPEGNELDVVQS